MTNNTAQHSTPTCGAISLHMSWLLFAGILLVSFQCQATVVEWSDCEYTVAFPVETQSKQVQVGSISFLRYESVYSVNVPYLRAECARLEKVDTRSALLQYANSFNVSISEITVEQSELGTVGMLYGTKVIAGADLPVAVLIKTYTGTHSTLMLMVVEAKETYPSSVTLRFINSPKRSAKEANGVRDAKSTKEEYQQKLIVKEVQTKLKAINYDPGPIDGILGRKTLDAITRFQIDHSLPREEAITEQFLLTLNTAATDSPKAPDYSKYFRSSEKWNWLQVSEGQLSLLKDQDYPCQVKAYGWNELGSERRRTADSPWYSFGGRWVHWGWKFVVYNSSKEPLIVSFVIELKSDKEFVLSEDRKGISKYQFISELNAGTHPQEDVVWIYQNETEVFQGSSWFNAAKTTGEGDPRYLSFRILCERR